MSHATPPSAPTPDDMAINTTDPSDADNLPTPDSLRPVASITDPHQHPDKVGLENNTTGPHQGE